MAKKLISIFGYPTHSPKGHVSPVDYPRIVQPLTLLNGYKDKKVEFQVDLWDGENIGLREWSLKVRNYDIVYFNYTVNDHSFAAMGSMVRLNDRKMVMDLDDGLWLMNPDNSVYDVYKKGSKGIDIVTDIINEVDYVTCTNSYLKNIIAANTSKRHNFIQVFPNYIDLKLYNKIPKERKSPFLNIVHYGSSSHFDDLLSKEFVEGMNRIMMDYPNVRFKTIGSFFPKFKFKWGSRYSEEHGKLNFMDWVKEGFPKVMEETDIFVAPLGLNNYNKAKSDIKRSEVGTTKKPFIGQRIRQYEECIEDGVDGMLASSASEWHEKIKLLLDDKDLRTKIGENGYKRVVRDMQIQDHIRDYAEFFKKVMGS